MNERIKELIKQAGGHSNISKFRGCFLPPPPGYIDPATVDLEKFAELIVIDIVNDMRVHAQALVGTGSDNEAFVLRTHASGIAKRFGVEEK